MLLLFLGISLLFASCFIVGQGAGLIGWFLIGVSIVFIAIGAQVLFAICEQEKDKE